MVESKQNNGNANGAGQDSANKPKVHSAKSQIQTSVKDGKRSRYMPTFLIDDKDVKLSVGDKITLHVGTLVVEGEVHTATNGNRVVLDKATSKLKG